MSYRIGQGILGSPDVQISIAKQEILPSPPANWTYPYYFYKLSFMNIDEPCHISINNGNWIYLDKFMGLNTDHKDMLVHSLRIQEGNIKFYWIGCF